MAEPEEKKLFLLDGHALVYRAHFAFITRPLINSKGMNVSAISGFTRVLWDVIKNQKPTHLAVAFDPSGPTFRHEAFPEYKANRDEQPEDISLALPIVTKIVEAFNIPIVMVPTFEADDVIGTLAKQAEKEGFEVYMMTPDKDYAQLVSDKVYMFKPSRQGNGAEILDAAAVCEKWGIQRVEQVIDMLGLQGDSVDNIPGIPGIGPKTAQKLLAKYDTIEGLLEHTHELKGKQKERVEEFGQQGLLSKELATININVPIQFDAAAYKIENFDHEALRELFKELEFRSIARAVLGEDETSTDDQGGQKNLFGESVATKSAPRFIPKPASLIADKSAENVEHHYHCYDTPEKHQELATLLAQQKTFCFDTETTSVDANQAELVGIAFSFKDHEAYYVPVPAEKDAAQAIVEVFRPVMEDPNIEKIGQNIKYDMLILRWYGLEVEGPIFDTMIAHYLIEPELRHNMNYLSETYLGYAPISIETLIGKKGKNQLSMRDVPVEKVVDYACEDADITWQLATILRKELEKEGLTSLFTDLEVPLVRTLVDMEFEGINLNAKFLEDYSVELAAQIAEVQSEIYEMAGSPFNIDSPKQVGQILFEKLEIPYRWKKTKTGQFSTNEEKLTEIANDYQIARSILDYRGLTKLKSTYVDALPRMINPRTDRIHSSFNQALAATGRLSSNNPNLQNIPIRTEAGRQVRKAFIPRDANHTLLAADYSQIELRLIAEISGDEAMIEAFTKGQDIHRATAARVYGVPYEEVDSDQRRNAKTVNFSIIYGAGSTNLSRQLEIKRGEAKELIDQYFAQYQGLQNYMTESVEKARESGYVTTLMGRRRILRDINSRNGMLRSSAERIAVNSPIQGTAADLIKVAMINIRKALRENNLKTKMILQVHDELVFDVPNEELETVKPIIEDLMKNAIPGLKVPILVGMDTGQDWLEAH
ncbi:MAG: DNA polymerase I [Bacteroidota bacterium]